MFVIAEEDRTVVLEGINEVIDALTRGVNRADKNIDVGDGLNPLIVSGYWVVDTIRIDVKIRK